ncbi:phage portal protein [Zooshikella sp. RANM57]|uniref:phage portal protein n=1 Tax=Zooshikella sp. RANM57 TaxID=3425863 RepID=UPI003D6F13D0
MSLNIAHYDTLSSGLVVPSASVAAYEGAGNGHRWADNVGQFGPDDAVSSGIRNLRDRSHQFWRNNPWVANGIAAWTAAAVSKGLTPRWRIQEEGLRKELQLLWGDWSEQADYDEVLDLYGLQTLAFRTVVSSGAAFVIKKIMPLNSGLVVPLQVQLVEPDMLATDIPEGPLENGDFIKGGILFSKLGKRKAYCFYTSHPAEVYSVTNFGETVWINAADVLHVYRLDRPGQKQSAPWISNCLSRLNELDQYEDAELVRKKTAALFAAFVYEAGGGNSASNPPFGKQKTKGSKRVTTMNPGTINYLPIGNEVKFSSPADVGTTYEPWLRNQLLGIAKGLGITYEMLTGDLKNVNYSSIRAGLLEFKRLCQQIQHNMIIHQLCRPIGRWFMDCSVASGAIHISDYLERQRYYNRINWQKPRWEEVDPLKTYLTDLGEVRSGFAPLSDKQAERGYDMEDLLEFIADTNKIVDKHKLRFDSDPRYMDGSGEDQRSAWEAVLNNE